MFTDLTVNIAAPFVFVWKATKNYDIILEEIKMQSLKIETKMIAER